MSYQSNNQNSPQGYGQRTSTLAILSLIAGIASYFIIPLIGAIAAIIMGGLAKKEIRESAGAITGLGMAKWGVVLGWINIGFSLIGLCLSILAITGAVTLPFCFIPFANLNY